MRRSKGARAKAAADRRVKKYTRSPAKGGVSGDIISDLLEVATDVLIGGAVVAGGILLREIVKGVSQVPVTQPLIQPQGIPHMGHTPNATQPQFANAYEQNEYYRQQQQLEYQKRQQQQQKTDSEYTKRYKKRGKNQNAGAFDRAGVITMRQNKEGVFVVPQNRK